MAKGSLAIRARANLQFLQYLTEDLLEITWKAYGSYQLGVLGVAGNAGGLARFYDECGVTMVTPSSDFFTLNIEFGGYGLFRFEFL